MNWALSTRSYLPTVRKWRWDLIAVGVVALIVWVVSTPASAYFLQIDTSAQDYVALAWAQGCWEYITEKMLPVLLLGPLFWLFGPSPHWETALLAVAASTSVTAIYELTRLLNNNARVGLFAALLFFALPSFQFYSRTYLGYLIPFCVLAWLAVYHNRWGWVGFFFGLAFTAHFNTLVTTGISLALLVIFSLRHKPWQSWLSLALGGLIPLAIVEGLFFLYMGHVYAFTWIRGIFSVTWRFSGVTGGQSNSDWLWVIHALVESNGWALTGFLALGLIAPAISRRSRLGLALNLLSLALFGFYNIQAGLGRSLMVPRLLVAAYPFWVISAASVIDQIIHLLPNQPARRLIAVSGFLIIGVMSATSTLFINDFSRTLYPAVEAWLVRAATEGRPVRFQGRTFIALFYAQKYGVEILANDEQWIALGAPGQAVLIFADKSPDTLSRADYSVSYVETESNYDLTYPALTYEAANPRRFELWWPNSSSQSVKPDFTPDASRTVAYYSGAGCLTPP